MLKHIFYHSLKVFERQKGQFLSLILYICSIYILGNGVRGEGWELEPAGYLVTFQTIEVTEGATYSDEL